MHCPKNNLNLCIEPEPVTVGADATVLYECLHLYRCEYTVLLLQFQQCQARLLCRDSDYFRDSVAAPCIYGMAACMLLCVTLNLGTRQQIRDNVTMF